MQLFRHHFAQALKAGDNELIFGKTVFFEFGKGSGEFLVVKAVNVLGGLISEFGDIHAEKRRLHDVDVAFFHKRREMPVKKREKEHLNVATVHVSVRENADLAVSEAL